MDFRQAEERFKQLKAQFATGTLSEAGFKTQLEELMPQDEQGNWWMIGYETEQWYRHDGKDWVRADPPGNISQISTQKPLKQEIGTTAPRTNSDDQGSFWKIEKREVIQFSVGLGVFTLLYLFDRSNSTFRYWSPAFAVPLFFGLVFGPMVGAIVGAGRYIIPIFILYQSDYISMPFTNFLSYYYVFSSITLFSFAIEGFIIGLAKPLFKNYLSFTTILRAELLIIMANLIRFLLSWDLSRFLRTSPDSLIQSLKISLWYPLIGGLILVPIGLMIYSFILYRRKARA
jgi:hypothetical protein